MFKSITLRCFCCGKLDKIAQNYFKKHTAQGYTCPCESEPMYYPYQKLFWLSERLCEKWRLLPERGLTIIERCKIEEPGFYVPFCISGFAFRFKNQRKQYRVSFDRLEMHQMDKDCGVHIADESNEWTSFDDACFKAEIPATTGIFDLVYLIKRWNTEVHDLFQLTGDQVVAADLLAPPRKAQ